MVKIKAKTHIQNINDIEVETPKIDSTDQVYDLIFKEDDVTWRTIIIDLAKSGKIDPWDVEISTLAQEYLKIVSKLKETNFRLSGKVISAAALLLRLKADRMGMKEFLQLTNPDESEEQFDEDGFDLEGEKRFSKAGLQPRIPGIRKRKVTVFELIDALKQALEVDQRREIRLRDYGRDVIRPVQEIKRTDWVEKIQAVFDTLRNYVTKFKRTTAEFTDIIPSGSKEDKIWTFLSLLHLANEGKVGLRQEEPFGKIYVDINEEELSKKLKREEIEEAVKPQEIIKEQLPDIKIKSQKIRSKNDKNIRKSAKTTRKKRK
ncbi:MAG: segregation/condensation protein A [Nanoarchaeota archaeon]